MVRTSAPYIPGLIGAFKGLNVNTLEGHTERVCCLQFDDLRLLSGSQVEKFSLCVNGGAKFCYPFETGPIR